MIFVIFKHLQSVFHSLSLIFKKREIFLIREEIGGGEKRKHFYGGGIFFK